MKPDPVIIASPARCGAAIVAGLLYYHGFWFGDNKPIRYMNNPGVFGIYNKDIDQVIKAHPVNSPAPGFRDAVLRLVPDDTPWLVKSPQALIRFVHLCNHFPNAIWLLPYRPPEQIAESAMYHPFLKKDGYQKRLNVAVTHQDLQTRIEKRVGRNSLWVDVNRLGAGDIEEAGNVMSFCGMELDDDAWKKAVNPSKWYQGARE